MDLSKLNSVAACNAGFELELFHPGTKEGLGVFVTVLGQDSDEYRKVFQVQQRKRLDRAMRGGGIRIKSVASPESLEQDANELLAACTKSWRTGEEQHLLIGGEKLECSRDNAMRVYRDYPWIKEQVDDAVNDRANFLGR